MALSDDLKRARQNAGLTMVEAAGELGMSQGSLSRIENGGTGITAQRLIDMAGVYGVSPSMLMDGAVVNALSDKDLDRIGEVIEFVEEVLSEHSTRPKPTVVRKTILAIFRQESASVHKSGAEFDPTRYRELISVLIKKD
ncbi:helix-turn-helix transcriptional regulator [Ascidiaceihabitans sp.]|uniref:helix-turn-helix domain-containing protein n=1 Tax=Ascidiaceihabitans sp. TaxID=1872644 RepID=UPI0032970B4F